MIKDSPTSRSPATSMRDLLRHIERQTITPPARPTAPPPAFTALAASQTAEPGPVRVGGWVLTEDAVSGDLVAVHDDGITRTLATRGNT